MRGSCSRKNCRFIHDKTICKDWFKGSCKRGDSCKWIHTNTSSESVKKPILRKKKKNTETFEPSHKPLDLRILVGSGQFYNKPIFNNDVIIFPNFFNSGNTYNDLLNETKHEDFNRLWKLWHGDSHLIADDKIGWKKHCPTFNRIIGDIRDYFRMDIKATRFNWYRSTEEWKPYHHDAAAIDPKKSETQNFTVGISFGIERDIAFEHARTKTTVTIPLEDGCLYAFAKNVNIDWRHGIPQLPPTQYRNEGRISIIAWGSVAME